ncbi:MAG: hypothetical protein P1V36_01765 [Planctomycetota bacterium]|nr:hypothetical protein [Planctomycetota bacterium]
MARSRRLKLEVGLSDDQEVALDSLVDSLKSDPRVQATAGRVTRQAALRYLIYEALAGRLPSDETLEAEAKGLGETMLKRVDEHIPVVEAEVEETDDPDTAESEEWHPPPLPAVINRPVDFEYWDEGPWDFPDDQKAVHDYYTQHGWIRCIVGVNTAGDSIQFYWNQKSAEQGLTICAITDAHGRGLRAQRDEAVGTIHVISPDWGLHPDEANTDLGDAGMWMGG